MGVEFGKRRPDAAEFASRTILPSDATKVSPPPMIGLSKTLTSASWTYSAVMVPILDRVTKVTFLKISEELIYVILMFGSKYGTIPADSTSRSLTLARAAAYRPDVPFSFRCHLWNVPPQ